MKRSKNIPLISKITPECASFHSFISYLYVGVGRKFYVYYFLSQPGHQDQSLKWSIDAICNHGKPSSCVNRKFIFCIIWLEGQDAIASIQLHLKMEFMCLTCGKVGVECLNLNKPRIKKELMCCSCRKDFLQSQLQRTNRHLSLQDLSCRLAAAVGNSVLFKATRTNRHLSLQDLSCRLAAAVSISVLFKATRTNRHLSLQDFICSQYGI